LGFRQALLAVRSAQPAVAQARKQHFSLPDVLLAAAVELQDHAENVVRPQPARCEAFSKLARKVSRQR